jgi:hypothetical protein
MVHMLNTKPIRPIGQSGAAAPLPWVNDALMPLHGMVHLGAERTSDTRSPELIDSIAVFRAQLCSKLHKADGKNFPQYAACQQHMVKHCNPGQDMMMDGDDGERTTGQGFCHAFFSEHKDNAKNAENSADAFEQTANPEQASQAEEVVDGTMGGGGSSDSSSSHPYLTEEHLKYLRAPGPAPSAAVPSSGHYKEIFDNMREDRTEPEQGFEGPDVGHDDMRTMTQDWHSERTPVARLCHICIDHPHNAWCRKKCGWPPRYRHHHHGHAEVKEEPPAPPPLPAPPPPPDARASNVSLPAAKKTEGDSLEPIAKILENVAEALTEGIGALTEGIKALTEGIKDVFKSLGIPDPFSSGCAHKCVRWLVALPALIVGLLS